MRSPYRRTSSVSIIAVCPLNDTSISSATAAPTAPPPCATSSAAKAPVSPKWRTWVCPSRRASRSPPSCASPTSKKARFQRRCVLKYGDVVFDLGKDEFEAELDKAKARRKVKRDIDLPADDLHDLVHDFKTIVKKRTGHPFPDDPQEQLWGAIEAVFKSWHTKRAKDYRQVNGIPDSLGTAVNIVAMVYGNMGDDCGTGVAFTRDGPEWRRFGLPSKWWTRG